MTAVLWNTKPEVLKYGPSLRGPCVKNEGLVFHGMARAIRLINSYYMAKTKIFRTFTDNFPAILWKTSTKLNQNRFPKVFCWFSNFTKIARKLTENFPKNNRSQVLSKAFSTVLWLSEVFREILRQFWSMCVFSLFSSWIHRAGWHYPARWSANQIARK